MKNFFIAKLIFLIALFFCLLPCWGCGAGKAVKPDSVLDNPWHHYKSGMLLFEEGQHGAAVREFDRARTLSPEFSPSYAGLGLVRAADQEFDEAFQLLKTAKKHADNSAEKLIYRVAMVRLYTMWQGRKWLKKACREFKAAKKLAPREPSPYFYMGRAHRIAGEFDRAAGLYGRVVELDAAYLKAADEEWEFMQRIERAQPGSDVVAQIARLAEIDRADVAALLVEELKLDKIFRRKGIAVEPRAYKLPTDYDSHQLRYGIKKVVGLQIRGIEEIRPGVFSPDTKITRANFAVVVEDILIRINGEADLPTRMIGSPSPFTDVREDYFAYNAIVVCTSRGIMAADMDGVFRKNDPVSGADALLVLRKLKEQLKY